MVEKPKEEVKGDMEKENASRPKIASAIEGFTGWGFRVWVFDLVNQIQPLRPKPYKGAGFGVKEGGLGIRTRGRLEFRTPRLG